MSDRVKGWLAPLYLALCLLLGGASGVGAGAIANGFLQLIAVLLIIYSLWTWRGGETPPGLKGLALILLLFVLVILASLVPLPYLVWEGLPGRDGVERGLRMLGLGQPSLPLSLAPNSSIQSILWLLPPLAMFLLVLQTTGRQRRRLPWAVLIVAGLSVGLGAAQLLAGEESALRFYQITNPTLPVGFFANANHLATLLLCALPLSGYLAARASQRSSSAKRTSGMALAIITAIFLLLGIAIIGSLAGYGLALVAGLAALLIYRRAAHGKLTKPWLAATGGAVLLVVALAFASPVQEQALSNKFGDRPTSRKVIAETSLLAIRDFLPLGTGLGTFADVYRTYDDPSRVNTEYVNHAHNDYLEVALELGIPGILLILAFILWWLRYSVQAWRSDSEGANLARAACVMIAIVLLHSVVDYPIRTSAIAALFATACALLLRPLYVERRRAAPEAAAGARHIEAV